MNNAIDDIEMGQESDDGGLDLDDDEEEVLVQQRLDAEVEAALDATRSQRGRQHDIVDGGTGGRRRSQRRAAQVKSR